MILLDNTLISEEVISRKFICDLKRCKGACCVEGESGAPLEKEELKKLEEVYPSIKPLLSEEGKAVIERDGLYRKDADGEYVTPLIGEKGACAFAVFENGIAFCAIEMGYNKGLIRFQKPLSCHLYPVRIKRYAGYETVSYHQWNVCAPACQLGQLLEIPVYRFVKAGLIRKYGGQWYARLEEIAESRLSKQESRQSRS
jgi:hypothetical protein